MLRQGFGNCGNHYECEAVCPKGIKAKFIAKLNREFIKAQMPGSGCTSGHR
jgi:succinate dehydrogenase / fumarate reductase iron-sulfur subunit